MSFKKWMLLGSMAFLSVTSYGQRGLTRTFDAALQRQVLSRAQLPTVRDGVRNLVTNRLGAYQVLVPTETRYGAVKNFPVSSTLNFKAKALPKQQPFRVTELPRIVGGRHDVRRNGFYSVANPGAGQVQAIALPAYALMTQVAIIEGMSLEDRKVLTKMSQAFDVYFTLTNEGEWKYKYVVPESFERIHRLVGSFKEEWPEYTRAYGGEGDIPLSQGMQAALDAIDIQAWMLANNGKFPQAGSTTTESLLLEKFNTWMDKVATQPAFAQDYAVQGAVQHLVHLRAAAKGAMTPSEVIVAVRRTVDNGGRIPGSSLAQVTPEENVLTQELNYVEQLRRANLLYIIMPMQTQQDAIALHLRDLQEQGHIYQQMIEIIPEFASDGVTLNVPSHSRSGWNDALEEWKRAHAGSRQTPRSAIAGRFGLPLNFNDLTSEEQTEVLLGTYLKITSK